MQRPMRSKLFVPGSRPELFAKAAASAADALSFDLEDAVAKDRKAEARAAVGAFLRSRPTDDGKVVVVRSNGLSSGLFEDDLKVIVGSGLDVLNLPMVESGEEVREAARVLARLEQAAGVERPIGILANIETPKGLRLAAEIATADPRIVGLQIGYADLFEPCGINRSDPNALSYVRMAIRLAAAEAKVPSYDGAYAVVAKPERYSEECEEARNLGFAGKSCIHPTQVPDRQRVLHAAPGRDREGPEHPGGGGGCRGEGCRCLRGRWPDDRRTVPRQRARHRRPRRTIRSGRCRRWTLT